MKIVSFHSGLGNQIYFYLYALYLKQKFPQQKIYGYYPKSMLSNHNGLEINHVFCVELPPSSFISNAVAFLCRAFHKLHIECFRTEEPNKYDDGVLFVGYFQDKKYFLDNIEALKFRDLGLDKTNLEVLKDIESTNSVSIHIRRGDYSKPELQRRYGNIATDEYYKSAVEEIEKRVTAPKYFVFSNDMDWCKNNMNLGNAVFVEGNLGKKSPVDMFLMSKCKHNIIANSSFSYWGAMLNKNADNIVVYPSIWDNYNTPDIFSSNWIGLI